MNFCYQILKLSSQNTIVIILYFEYIMMKILIILMNLFMIFYNKQYSIDLPEAFILHLKNTN